MVEGFAALLERGAGLEPGERLAPVDLLRCLEGIRDMPLPEWCEVFAIPEDDPREALRRGPLLPMLPQTRACLAGALLGSEVWFKYEHPGVVQDAPSGWANGCALLYEAAVGAYIVESMRFNPRTAYGEVEGFGFQFDCRRECVNAPQIDPYS
ncbi:hypothetical protein ABPG75_004301 [Micractinium tetrahymenae]